MLLLRMLYNTFALLYAGSLVLVFVDAIQPRRVVNRAALLLLFTAFVLLTFLLFTRLQTLGQASVYSHFDAALLWAWLILVVSLVVNWVYKIDLFLFFGNVVGFSLVVYDTFAHQSLRTGVKTGSDVLLLHVTLAVISYTAFTFAFVFSVMYLLLERSLRQKRFNRWYFRLGSLDKLDAYTLRAVMIGFVLLLAAIVLGVIWEDISTGKFILFDVKTWSTSLLWVLYGTYLAFRVRAGWSGRALMQYHIVCYALLVINFAVLGHFSSFHHGF